MSAHERELWEVYVRLGRLYAHWTLMPSRDGAPEHRTAPHACSDRTCRPVELGIDPIDKRNLYLCDISGRYHVCGKTFCDSAIGRHTQWICDIFQTIFPPDMCVYQNDLIRQCVVLNDEHNLPFLHAGAFDPHATLHRRLDAFRESFCVEQTLATATRHGWTFFADHDDVEHFDQLFLPARTKRVRTEDEQKLIDDQTRKFDAVDGDAGSVGGGVGVGGVGDGTDGQASTQKIQGLKRKKNIIKLASVQRAKKPKTHAKKTTSSSSSSSLLSPTKCVTKDTMRTHSAFLPTSSSSMFPVPAAAAAAAAAATTMTAGHVLHQARLDDRIHLSSSHAMSSSSPSPTLSAARKTKPPMSKKMLARQTPFRFDGIQTATVCEEYAREVLHRIVAVTTNNKALRRKLRALCLFQEHALQIRGDEYTHLCQLALQCWNSWVYIESIMRKHADLVTKWLPIYTLDMHCVLMLIASCQNVTYLHWLGENNPHHKQLSDVCPDTKHLRTLAISKDRMQVAMQCMHDISLYAPT